MLKSIFPGMLLALLFFQCSSTGSADHYQSESLRISRLTAGTFVHTSFLETQSFGKVPCNGLIFVHGGEALIFDTPTDDSTSIELINWVQGALNCKIKGVVATHFHDDCLGGLQAFHHRGIQSLANHLTLTLAKEDGAVVPNRGFEDRLALQIGEQEVICAFIGEGHTRDNIVGYIPSEKVLFGGCLIKSLKAGKGYLGDANVEQWPGTVKEVKKKFADAKWVIPGHGKEGGLDLLDYTIELFEEKHQ